MVVALLSATRLLGDDLVGFSNKEPVMFSRCAGSLWSATATRVGCFWFCTAAVVFWQSASLQAGYLGIEVTNSPDSGGATYQWSTHETLSLYIRPTQDIIVTHLGFHNGWMVLRDFYRDAGIVSVFEGMRLTDPHTLGIFETDPNYYHSESEPGNGNLLVETVMGVGEGVEENYFEFKEIAPTLLQAGKLYAIAGTGSSRPADGNNSTLDDGDPTTYYFHGYPGWDDSTVAVGPGVELLGGAYSYLPGLGEPFWFDVTGMPDYPPGAVDPGVLYLGPGFKYELTTQSVPEPGTALLSLIGMGSLGLYRRWTRLSHQRATSNLEHPAC